MVPTRPNGVSELFWHKAPSFECGLIVVCTLRPALWQANPFMRNLFVGDKAEELGDAVEACTLFVIGAHDVPGCGVRIGDL